ncbi:MAG: hypothetical protein ACJA2P_002276 [Rhodoferax sp.]
MLFTQALQGITNRRLADAKVVRQLGTLQYRPEFQLPRHNQITQNFKNLGR